jgi:hypothetical protein
MNPDELVQKLTSMSAAHALAMAVRDPDMQATRGWNLSRWRCDEAQEAVRFVHHTPRGQPDIAVLCVHGPPGSEWVYEATLPLAPCPTRLVVLNE